MAVAESKVLVDKSAKKRRFAENHDFADKRKELQRGDIFNRITTREVCRIARQLATLLQAGMPLVPALSALVEQLQTIPERKITLFGAQDNTLAKIMEQITEDVKAGSTLAAALSKHPQVFSNLFVSMVAAGEASGMLEEVLLRLAEMLEKRIQLAGKVKSAVAYPVMMIIVAVGVVVFLLSFVVPMITQIFLEMNRTLPWPTRLLISTSAFLRTYFVLVVAVVCAVFFAIAAGCKTRQSRLFLDRFKLKLPLFGKLFLKLEIARLTRTLGTLLISGVPILDALETAKAVVQNHFIAGAIDSVRNLVSRGDNIANAIRKTGLFPPIVFHVISAGQISGDVESGLMSIADMYDGEVEMTAKTLVSLLEPSILLIMGAVVGFIVLAILLPIFEISNVV